MEVKGQLNAWLLYVEGKIPWYPLNVRLGEPKSQSEFCGEE
jgi:hypothetical protein